MKKWQKRLVDVATFLQLLPKVKEGKLSADDQKSIFAEYEKKYGVTFQSDREANEDEENTATQRSEDFLLSESEQLELSNLILEEGEQEGGEAEPPTTGRAAYAAMKRTIETQKKTINQLASDPEPVDPLKITPTKNRNDSHIFALVAGHTAHTKTHLFGNDCEFMSRSKWWNEITATRKEVNVAALSEEDKSSFIKEFNEYAKSLSERSKYLTDCNAIAMLDYSKMIAGTSPFTSYEELDAKFGEYTVRRQDVIIAFFRSLPSVSHIFPVQSGVRNKEVVPTVQFGELSQGYRKGKIFKGNVKFSAETYKVDDVMFKYDFDDMIALQKRYVMDLSKGSSPFQWTFIEWVITYFGKQLHNEQQLRRVMGVRVPQQNVTSNPAMLASDGILRAIEKAENELKVLPFGINELGGVYDESTIVDYFENFWDLLDDILPSMEGIRLYANMKHKKWYLRAFRQKYGTETDFGGVKSGLIDVNPEEIVWVPNMPKNCFKIWATYAGNLENLEYVPNEMLAFKFREEFENVTVLSRWMEGSVCQRVGVQYKTLDELKASEREYQWLFTNFPVTQLEDGAKTVNGKQNNVFITGENSAATAITDILNADQNRVYKIIAGDVGANKTKINKTGKFSSIESAWSPVAVGDFIEFYLELEDYEETVEGVRITKTRPTGNFLELSRKVSV
jgi:hypothetical protein